MVMQSSEVGTASVTVMQSYEQVWQIWWPCRALSRYSQSDIRAELWVSKSVMVMQSYEEVWQIWWPCRALSRYSKCDSHAELWVSTSLMAVQNSQQVQQVWHSCQALGRYSMYDSHAELYTQYFYIPYNIHWFIIKLSSKPYSVHSLCYL
jgi:hypothetical protein